jgi:hypothetical protein
MSNLGFDAILVPEGTVVTASGTGAAIEVDDRDEFRGAVDVTAASGTTPSLTVNIQTSFDNGVTDAWRTVASFAAVTTVSTTAREVFAGLDRWVRATWTVSGTTPSITFGVAGEIV